MIYYSKFVKIHIQIKKGKLYRWFLSLTLYVNLVSNLSIISIWSLTFQCRINLILIVIHLDGKI